MTVWRYVLVLKNHGEVKRSERDYNSQQEAIVASGDYLKTDEGKALVAEHGADNLVATIISELVGGSPAEQ
jgi:hypothetical protein